MNKIKVLLLGANPVDAQVLRLDEGVRNISDEIDSSRMREVFEVMPHLAMRPSDLQRFLLKYQPDIVHFSGHGTVDGEMVFEDETGKSKPIDKSALATVFRLHKNNIRLIFFNACFSKSQAEAISSVIDYTIGIHQDVSDNATIAFGAAFYRALAYECSVETAFESAKVELDILGIPGSKRPELFIRPGADREVSFVHLTATQSGERDAEIKRALVQLVAGKADDKEKALIRSALAGDSVVLERAEGGIKNDLEVTAALASKTGASAIRLELSETTYQVVRDQLYPAPFGLLPPLPGLTFVGRDKALVEIKQRLGVEQERQPGSNFTVVRGVPGVGKTTLVGVLARDSEVSRSFRDGILWTVLDQEPELMSKIAAWGRQLGADDLLRVATLDEATERLAALLRNKQMLLIVDDIWNVAHALPFLRAANTSRCVLLATTRLTSVATELAETANSSDKVYRLPELTEENALILLRHVAPAAVDEHFEDCLALVRDLECLPLALNVAGRLLKEEAQLGLHVPDLITDIREKAALLPQPAPPDRAEGATLPTVNALLSRSTDLLDSQTRDCFAYLGVFAPKPATFDVEAMKAVWLLDDPKPIIRKLVGYGLLEAVGGGRFQMHALLVQHASSLLD